MTEKLPATDSLSPTVLSTFVEALPKYSPSHSCLFSGLGRLEQLQALNELLDCSIFMDALRCLWGWGSSCVSFSWGTEAKELFPNHFLCMVAAGWGWRDSQWCRWQIHICFVSILYNFYLVKNFPTLPCALQNKTQNCFVWHFFFFWSFPCSHLKPEMSGPTWQPLHPKAQRAQGVKFLFRALYVKSLKAEAVWS